MLHFVHHAGLEKCEYRPDNKSLYSKHLVRAIVVSGARERSRWGVGARGKKERGVFAKYAVRLTKCVVKAIADNAPAPADRSPSFPGRQLVGQDVQGMANLD